MNLLIDMGNTRLKWAVGNGLGLSIGQAISNVEINHDALVQLWQAITAPNQIAISCVSAKQLLDLVISVANELWPEIPIIQAKSQAHGFGITNAYHEPEKLGVDRWLSMIAAFHKYRTALCIVGCGTAITVDVVDSSGKHLGGLISPGLRLMKAALAKGTENLSMGETVFPFGLATNTDAAIHNGTLSAACGLIEFALKDQPADLQLVLTGGDAEIIALHLSQARIIHPELVLNGLAITLLHKPL
jgi:type III pantothenate kinase